MGKPCPIYVSEAIQFRQREFGWTAKRMAEAIGMKPSHYSEMMNGKRRLPYSAACRAHALGVPAAILLNIHAIEPKFADVYGDRQEENEN